MSVIGWKMPVFVDRVDNRVPALKYGITSHDEATNDNALVPPVMAAISIGIERDPVEVAPDQHNAGNACNKNIANGDWFYQRHSNLHVFPQRYEDPNEEDARTHRSAAASDSFASAVDSASAIHRHAYIMVNAPSQGELA